MTLERFVNLLSECLDGFMNRFYLLDPQSDHLGRLLEFSDAARCLERR